MVGCASEEDAAIPSHIEPVVLSWTKCTGTRAPDEPFLCATMNAPLDYRHPEADTVPIALVKLPATADSTEGVILTNPGGPGASGVDFLVGYGQSMVNRHELAAFDLVGFDPRGVERSGGLRCQSNAELDKYAYVDPTPDSPAEKSLYDEASGAFERACTKKYGSKLRHYSTENVARDMDLIRASMGYSEMNYIGISYGTYLGGVYATLFPDRVRSMVLDGPFDPQGDTVEQKFTTQAKGFEDAFNNWVKWCEGESSCAFSSSDIAGRYDRLIDALDARPLRLEDGREANNVVMETATNSAMYTRSSWPALAFALADAESGNGARMMRLADAYNERDDDGTYTTLSQAFPIIRCASGFGSPAVKDAAALVKRIKEVAPRYARDVEESDFTTRECDGLMKDPKMVEIGYSGDARFLVIGGENDPATPFRWAEEMATRLGSQARLVSFSGEGHSQILQSRCVDGHVRDFMASRTYLPAEGAVCHPDPPVTRPAWWSRLPAPDSLDVSLARAEMDAYVGLSGTEAYTTYLAVKGSRRDAFIRLSTRLARAGFVAAAPLETGDEDGPHWFEVPGSGDYLGVYVVSPSDLAADGQTAPDGPVPVGRSLVLLYYMP